MREGDRVICVDVSQMDGYGKRDPVELGACYTVSEVNGPRIKVLERPGLQWWAKRFISAKPELDPIAQDLIAEYEAAQ